MLSIQALGDVRVATYTGGESFVPDQILHQEELKVYRTMSKHRASEYLRGRYTLKNLFLGEPKNWAVLSGPDGRPYIASMPEKYCSISHTDGYVLAALSSEQRIGVDVERVMPRHSALLHEIASERERNEIAVRFPMVGTTVAWCIKEACAKADENIFPLAMYRISFDERITVSRGARHWVVMLSMLPRHVSAIAIAQNYGK
jgi:phosphopantetheinyl transferase